MESTKPNRKPRRHFGGIRKLPSGNWQATYWRDGKQHATTFSTKADANAHLSVIEADVRRGRWADPRHGQVPVAAYAETWLSERPLRATTLAKYRGLLDRHLLPVFGGVKLADLKTADISAWHAQLRRRHPSTAAAAYRLLATICNAAVREERIARSPCQVPGAGRERAAERPTATVAELQQAVDAADERFRCGFLLAAWGQLRRSEILGLQRGDFDLAAGTVRVRRSWTLAPSGRCFLDEPKTEAGKRTLHLPETVRDAVADHLDRFVATDAGAWLFPSKREGEPAHPRTFARAWDRAREAVGRPDLHLHDLRHSGLTWVAQSGASLAELMRRGGHASPTAAIRYQHAADERDRAIADALGRLS